MMKCPLCGELARIRTSRYITNETKENHNQCQNVNCSATFISHESVSRFIVRPTKVNSVDMCAGAV